MISDLLDRAALAEAFARNGRLHIPAFLKPEAAKLLGAEISAGLPWRLSLNSSGKGIDLPVAQAEALDEAAKRKLDDLIYAEAARGFQYRFDSYRLSDEIEVGRRDYPNLSALYDFLNSPLFLDFIADLTGEDRGIYCDAQVTRYRSGHFLTTHTDLHEGKQRLFAFVLNLSPDWRSDWGGLLQFLSPDGHVKEAFAPTMNALNIFRVPQPHAVSYVTPFAAAARVSVTGWIRAARD